MPQIFLGTRSLMRCRSSTLHPSNARHVFCDACTGHGAPFFKPQAWSGCAWVSTIALGCNRSNFPSQSRPQSIITLASRYDTSSELCMRCRRVRVAISPRVPRKVSFTGQDESSPSVMRLIRWSKLNARGRTPSLQISKKEPAAREHAILFKNEGILMGRRNSQSRPPRDGLAVASVLLIMLLVCAGEFSTTAQEPVRTPQGTIATFAPVVEKVVPTVVTVFTTQRVSKAVLPSPLSDEALREFFGGQVPQKQGKQTLEGLGSGVIVSADGYILTANHVVAKADEIMVGLGAELRKYKAKKVGTDPGTDVALLKIEEKNLPAITFADSDKARAGDVVLALGNPFGLRQTVTMGIISAVGRGGMGIVDYENFIQTDAAINMGNSGGALVDTEGRLLGINSA